MSMKKVVVTGLGALAPNGNSVDQFWSAIKSGTSGIAPITYFDTSDHRVSIAGELKDFHPEQQYWTLKKYESSIHFLFMP